MPQQTLDYQRPTRGQMSALPWYKTDLVAAAVTAGIILSVNGWLVWNADKSWGFWIWLVVFIPVVNGVLAAALLAASPIVRWLSGCSASLHVWITLIGCGAAVIVDAAIIVVQLRGC